MNGYLLALGGQVSLLMLGGLAAAALMRRRSAALRHWVLSAVLLSAACLPALRALAPQWGAGAWPVPASVRESPTGSPSPGSLREPTVAVSLVGASAGAARDEAAPAPSIAEWFPAAWAAGAGLALAVLAVGLARLRWLARGARPLDDPAWTRLAADIARTAGLDRPVTLLQSDRSAILAAWGWRRPVVLVPRSATAWPRADVEIVLRHEVAHLARGDWFVQLLAEAVRAANWFNPLVWIAASRLRAESERACDDAVLRQGVAGADYAARLVALARRLNAGRRWNGVFPAPAMARPSSLERRVSAMLNARVDRAPLTPARRAVVVCIALALALPVAGLAVFAQAPGTFTGRVFDPTGRPMDARVKLTDATSKVVAEVRTGKRGTFEATGLPAGDYVVEVSQPGFAMLKITVTMGSVGVKRDLKMQIGSIRETISIRASASSGPAAPAPPPAPRAPSPVDRKCQADPDSGGNIDPPRKLRDVKPEYPANLVAQKVAGQVVLESVVGKDGTVKDIKVVEAPHPDLGRALADAVSRWLFEPTLLNCEPVEVKMRVSARFGQ